jgi:hypothetical protein
MATIRREAELGVAADRAWVALSDFGNAGNLFAGVLVGCRRAGNIRTVTFANGFEVNERLVAIDENERRLAYTVLDGPFSHHNASMQIVKRGSECTFVWISDFLPDEAAAGVLSPIEEGCRALQRNLAAD